MLPRSQVRILKSMKNPPVTSASAVLPLPDRTDPATAELCAAVAMVNDVVAGEPLGVTVAGVKEHVASAGSPAQEKLTCWLNPPAGVMVIVDWADWPAFTKPLAGEAA